MIQGNLFEQPKEFRIAVIIALRASPPNYPEPYVYINYYADFYDYLIIHRTEGDLFNYLTVEQAEEVARKRAAIVVTNDEGCTNVWPSILAQGQYQQIIGEVPATSCRIPVKVKYLLDPQDKIIPLYHPMELPFYGPLIQRHYQGLANI
jgi:hypothetical protein